MGTEPRNLHTMHEILALKPFTQECLTSGCIGGTDSQNLFLRIIQKWPTAEFSVLEN